MKYLITENFCLEHSLLCGQVFRWQQHGTSFQGFIKNTPSLLEQKGNKLYFSSFNDSLKRKDFSHYFNLNQDLKKITKKINRDPHINKAIQRFHGLRIINQQPWECLFSFILSQYSNIPRINRCIDAVCKIYGKKTIFEGKSVFLFPSPEQVIKKGPSHLDSCSLGYRKEFIEALVKEVYSKNISLGNQVQAPYLAARDFLLSFNGVGLKVADSVCLFSLQKFESFPIDVWVQKIMNSFYFKQDLPKSLSPKKYREIQEFASEYFGSFAGWAQQYLYYFYRLNPTQLT